MYTPWTNGSPLEIGLPKRKLLPFFAGDMLVSGRVRSFWWGSPMTGITFLGVDIHLPSFNRKHIFNSMGPFFTSSMLVFLGVNEMNPCLGKTLKIQGGQSEFTTFDDILKGSFLCFFPTCWDKDRRKTVSVSGIRTDLSQINHITGRIFMWCLVTGIRFSWSTLYPGQLCQPQKDPYQRSRRSMDITWYHRYFFLKCWRCRPVHTTL